MGTEDVLRPMIEQAERDLNSYEAKTGSHRTSVNDGAGVDTRVENKFPGAKVRYDQDLSTNRGYNKRIPIQEGGDLDARGRQTRGEHFEGEGGPEHKLSQQARDYGGENNTSLTGKHNSGSYEYTARNTMPYSHRGEGALQQGKEAAQSNMEGGRLPHKSQFKGSDYYVPESVPDSISAEGHVPPESVTQASREAKQF
ncbi:hypothetical protein BX600DRAFT_547639 [Xylariales sp. PMI_506]|nr:hypothetical protein BX600DRAFT_547639 [Xylariales sp. PMI_506]